ncbi:MAG: hypothetical protein A3G04_01695 [Candidatus Taylorbacteria bacterium RIFCSPLOWO2_12_FULL_44_9]|uniref:Glycosyltransferase RgtA/B/C/D-like domain-containing protein n=3 Tax=Candidatus Giovannoniibacteriota TaxID=1752738 RepID=A0A0G1PBE8_9BACT|nr:MAG: hypothetical protein UX06_C0052G0006 [Candidatus Giovannonibacteria bacterium GW2011_GWA2_45_21]OHA44230.1 MAG: hypothetical protein A3G04_01695 [Candidatus Taylorbacteria bacterium RIFCSPLOWO2_12_FULL_44_9]
MFMADLILFLISGFGLGLFIVNFLDPSSKLSKSERFIGALVMGFLVQGFEILILALATRSLPASSYISLLINLFFVFKYRSEIKEYWESIRNYFVSRAFLSWNFFAIAILFILFLGVIFQVLIIDERGYPLATLIGWGDIAYHLDMIAHLAWSDPFVLDQPIANGAPLTYSFLINFLSAILLRLGLNLFFSWYIPTLIFSIALFFGLYGLGKRFFSSRTWATVLLVLVLFGGGLGFFYFYQDLKSAYDIDGWQGVKMVLGDPPHQYTHMDMRTGGKPASADSPLNIVWITPVISFFSHQRSFVLGASLLIFLLLGWAVYEESEFSHERRYFVRWIPLLGLLPFIHAHTFIAAGIIFVALGARKILFGENFKWWVIGASFAALLALPQLLLIFQPKLVGFESSAGMFKPWWGWMTCQHSISWLSCDPDTKGTDTSAIWFWTKNFGIIFWAWLLTMPFFIFIKSSKFIRALIPASLFLFIIPNLILFQPWEFDNNKVIFYWWLLALIIIITVLIKIPWRFPRFLALAVLLVLGTLAGFVDVSSRVRQTVNAFLNEQVADHAGYYGESEIVAASWIKANTEPNDAFLSSDGASNFIPMLTGRPIFLGFPGWLWTQGNSQAISQRQAIARQFFQTANPSILCSMGVRWLMWEMPLHNTYPDSINANLNQLGKTSFTQNTPYGQRSFIQLFCPNG